MEPIVPQKIYNVIPKVMAEVGVIAKNGFNTFDKYNFRSIDDVYNKLQPVLAKNAVFFVPSILESKEDHFKSQKGTDQIRVKLKVKYMIFTDDGSSIEAVVEGEGIDRSDKATNKALTAAFKYLLIQIFCIAVEGIEEADSESPEIPVIKEKPRNGAKAPDPIELDDFLDEPPRDIKISDGKYRGKRLMDIPLDELKNYIAEVDKALKETGRTHPKWFAELKKASGL